MVGLSGAATSAGQLLFIPLLTRWAQTVGWAQATLIVAGAALLLAPLLFALLRDRPEDVGLRPDGRWRPRTPRPRRRPCRTRA